MFGPVVKKASISHIWTGCDLSVTIMKIITMTCMDVIYCSSCKEGITRSYLDSFVQHNYYTYIHICPLSTDLLHQYTMPSCRY